MSEPQSEGSDKGKCMFRLVLDVSHGLVVDIMYWGDRNLSHPVAQQLESLVEQFNPDYNRKNKQRSKEVWGPKLMKSKPADTASALFWQYLDSQCCSDACTRTGSCLLRVSHCLISARLSVPYFLRHHSGVAMSYGGDMTLRNVSSWHVATCRWPLQPGRLFGARKPFADA